MTNHTSYIRQERRARSTGAVVQVLDLRHPDTQFAPEDDCVWATVCVTHGTICVHPTLALARSHAADPAGWCERCRGVARVCASCLGDCYWHDEAWVCDSCGDEWYPDHGSEYAAPGAAS